MEVTVNSKEEISYNFCLNFVQEFGLWSQMNSATLCFSIDKTKESLYLEKELYSMFYRVQGARIPTR